MRMLRCKRSKVSCCTPASVAHDDPGLLLSFDLERSCDRSQENVEDACVQDCANELSDRLHFLVEPTIDENAQAEYS